MNALGGPRTHCTFCTCCTCELMGSSSSIRTCISSLLLLSAADPAVTFSTFREDFRSCEREGPSDLFGSLAPLAPLAPVAPVAPVETLAQLAHCVARYPSASEVPTGHVEYCLELFSSLCRFCEFCEFCEFCAESHWSLGSVEKSELAGPSCESLRFERGTGEFLDSDSSE